MILVSSYSFRLPNTLALVINVRPLSKGLHCISKNFSGQSLGLKVGKLDFYRQIWTSNARIWFHLYDHGTGKPYKGTTATKVSVPIGSDIDQFRDAVKVNYSDSHLKGISPSDLLVFQNKQSFDKRNSNEEKEEPLEEDSPVDGLGKSKKDALIVSFIDMSKKHKSTNIQLNSIDISTEHMKRPELVLKLATRIDRNRFVRLTSPAGSGKTSLLSLYEQSYPDKHIIYISFKIYGTSCNELFMANGIDLKKKTVKDEIRHNDTIVLIDDAQEKYDNIGFWEDLIKVSPKWLPENMKFVIVSTHLLIGGKSPSPAEMEELPKLERKDFLLSYNESLKFLESPVIGLPQKMQFDTLKTLIAEESCGLIGALRRSVDFLNDNLEKDSGNINSENSDQAVNGEIDFYLNGELQWGIELLVNGDGVGEHISRFEPPHGKYVALEAADYAIVDFRKSTSGRPTNFSRHPNRISVFFKVDDYSAVECIFGEDPDIVEIKLAN